MKTDTPAPARVPSLQNGRISDPEFLRLVQDSPIGSQIIGEIDSARVAEQNGILDRVVALKSAMDVHGKDGALRLAALQSKANQARVRWLELQTAADAMVSELSMQGYGLELQLEGLYRTLERLADPKIQEVADKLHEQWDRDRHLESPTVHEGDVNLRTGYFRTSYPHLDGLRAARDQVLALRYAALNRLELAQRIDEIKAAIPPLGPKLPSDE
jgi:hypothetical protein